MYQIGDRVVLRGTGNIGTIRDLGRGNDLAVNPGNQLAFVDFEDESKCLFFKEIRPLGPPERLTEWLLS